MFKKAKKTEVEVVTDVVKKVVDAQVVGKEPVTPLIIQTFKSASLHISRSFDLIDLSADDPIPPPANIPVHIPANVPVARARPVSVPVQISAPITCVVVDLPDLISFEEEIEPIPHVPISRRRVTPSIDIEYFLMRREGEVLEELSALLDTKLVTNAKRQVLEDLFVVIDDEVFQDQPTEQLSFEQLIWQQLGELTVSLPRSVAPDAAKQATRLTCPRRYSMVVPDYDAFHRPPTTGRRVSFDPIVAVVEVSTYLS